MIEKTLNAYHNQGIADVEEWLREAVGSWLGSGFEPLIPHIFPARCTVASSVFRN